MSTIAASDALPVPDQARRFLRYRVISRLYFHLPVLVPFLVLERVGTVATAVLVAAYGIAIAVVSPHGGAIRARLGLRAAVAGGEIIRGLCIALFAVTNDPAPLIAAQIVSGAAFAVVTNADLTMARRLFAGEAFGRFQARAQSAMFVATVTSGVAGAWLFQLDRQLPFIAGAAICSVSAWLVYTLARGVAEPEDEAGAPPAPAAPAADGTPPAEPQLRLAMTSYVVCRGTAMAAAVGILPLYLVFDVGVSVGVFGIVIGAFSVAGFLAARNVDAIVKAVGERNGFLACIGLTAVAYLLTGAFEEVAVVVVAVLLLGAAAGAVRPLALKTLAAQVAEPRLVPVYGGRMERWFGWTTAALVGVGLIVAQEQSAPPVFFAFAALSGLACIAAATLGSPAATPSSASG